MIGPATIAAGATLLEPASQALLREAFPRLLVSLGVLAWVARSAHAATRRMIGPESRDVTGCAVAVLVASCVLVPAFLLGAFSVLHDWAWALGVVVAANLMWAWSRGVPARGAAGVATLPQPSAAFTIALGGLMIGRAVYGLRNPPADVDTIVYHLPMVAHWYQSGDLGAPLAMPPAIGTYFPGSGELLQLWAAWSTGRETLMSWVGILSLGVLGLALRPIALMAGARGPLAEAIAVSLCASPGVIQLTLGTRIDIVVAAWFAAGLLFALRFRRHDAPGDLALMMCAAGLLSGTKTNGPVFALFLVAVWAVGPGALGRLRMLAGRRASLLIALVLTTFWYARNLIASGNPLFPARLHLGGRELPGLLDADTLRRTSQLGLWIEGHVGHLTPRSLETFFGVAIAIWTVGLALRLVSPRARTTTDDAAGTGNDDTRRPGVGLLGGLALACLALFLVIPFSGASLPAAGGRPPVLSIDNIRYLLPCVVALAPLVAVGLGRVPFGPLVIALLAAAALFELRALLGHLLPGVLLSAGLYLSIRALRVPIARHPVRAMALGVVAGGLLLGAGVTVVDPLRERLTDDINEGYIDRFQQLTAAQTRVLRTQSDGRPIALVGLFSLWPFYGRDFSGHPVYVPLDLTGEEARRPYRFLPDPRSAPDRERWLASLSRARAAYVVIGPEAARCDSPHVESQWCASEPILFRLDASHGCVLAYRVRLPEALPAGR